MSQRVGNKLWFGNLFGDCDSGRMPMWRRPPLSSRCERAELGRHSGGVTRQPVQCTPAQVKAGVASGKKIGPSFSSSSPLSEFVCPSDRAAEGPRDGDGGHISSADLAAAAAAPPLGLLPSPHRARVTGVSSAHHVEVGGFPAVSSDVASHSRLAIRGCCR